MNNRPLIITLIVILSIIAILLIAYLIFALITGNTLFYNSFGIKRSENIVFNETYKKEDINNLEVISSAGDVSVFESTDDNVKVIIYGKNSEDVKVSLKDGKLKIDFQEKKQFISFGTCMKDIEIYAPKDILNKINIDIDYGDLKIENFESTAIEIKQDCGDVEIGIIKNATIKSSYGDVKIDTILNKCNIDLSCGDVKIKNLQINEDSSIKNSLGDIKIEKTSDIYIDAKTDLGDTKVNLNNRQAEITLTIENSCGDIKVNN